MRQLRRRLVMARGCRWIAFGHGQVSAIVLNGYTHAGVAETEHERGELSQMESRRVEGAKAYLCPNLIGQRSGKPLFRTHGAAQGDDIDKQPVGVLMQTHLVIPDRQIGERHGPPFCITRCLENERCLPKLAGGLGDIRIRMG